MGEKESEVKVKKDAFIIKLKRKKNRKWIMTRGWATLYCLSFCLAERDDISKQTKEISNWIEKLGIDR